MPLQVSEAQPPRDVALPFDFAIAMAVRPGDTALRDALDRVIERRRVEIEAIIDAYAVARRRLEVSRAAAIAEPTAHAGASR